MKDYDQKISYFGDRPNEGGWPVLSNRAELLSLPRIILLPYVHSELRF